MTAVWQGGKTYVPGSLVIPTAGAAPVQVQPENAGFETGDKTGWTTSDASRWTVGTNKYQGTYGCRVTGDGLTSMQSNTQASVKVGQQVSVSVKCSITNDGTDDAHFQVVLQWLDSGGSLIGFTAGNEIQGKGGFWTTSTASGVAPAGTAKFNISLSCNPGSHGSVVDLDSAAYIYAYAPPTAGIVYKATQAAPGKSAATEPAWPGVVGVPITDNQVTWEGELATRIVWEASPLSESGGTEPTWPLDAGANVHDGSINYTAQSLQITDPNCPHSKYVVIAASKVYAADVDIIRYCATVNPLDWTTANDAGYLAYGLQDYGSNPCVALGLYRSNVVAFNAEGFQMWQVDPDPANIALLDALPVATEHHHALAPTSNDLFFLATQGVRSMGISSAGVNLEAGDIGMPIDDIVQEALETAAEIGVEPIATFIPGMGQYWLSFPPPRPLIVGTLPDTCDDVTYAASLEVTLGVPPYSNPQISSGTAPDGTTLTIVGDALNIGFVDADAGDYVFFITAQDSLGSTALPFRCSITVRHFEISGSLPDGDTGTAYSEPLSISEGIAPYGVPTITSGAMPTGGTLDIVGETVVVAWPIGAEEDTYGFEFTVTDSTGCVATYSASVVVGETWRDVILALNPVFCLPCTETSGTVASDISGNGYHGTIQGTVAFDSATQLIPGESSFEFGAGGSHGYVTIAPGSWENVWATQHWTLMAIARSSTATPSSANPVICGQFQSSNTGLICGMLRYKGASTGQQGGYGDTSGAPILVSKGTGSVITTAFLMMVTRDFIVGTGMVLKLYINGDLVDTFTNLTDLTGETNNIFSFTIGGEQLFPSSYQWQGWNALDTLFDTTLTSSDALKIAQKLGYA